MNESYIYGQMADAYAFENLTVSSTAKGLTAAKLTPTTTALVGKKACRITVSCETNPVRFCFDGTTPTTSLGHLLAVGERATFEGTANLSNLKFIATGSDSSLMITYEHFSNKI